MKNEKTIIAVLALLLIIVLAGCKTKTVQLPTMSPAELAIAQTKFAYQQETKSSILTQTRAAMSGETLTTPGFPQESGTAIDPSLTTEPTLTEASLSPTSSTLTAFPSQVTPTSFVTQTPPPNQSSTPTLKPTQTPTRTTTTVAPSGWGGTWTAWLEQADGSIQTGTLTVIVNGSDMTGEVTLGTSKMTLVGKLYENDTVISGIYSLPPNSGRFYWKNVSLYQFGGNTENLLAFCAARQGSPKPDPCVIVVPR